MSLWDVFHISEVAALGSILLLSSAARGAEYWTLGLGKYAESPDYTF